MGTIPPKNHANILLVEGRDDVFTIANLLNKHGVSYPTEQWFPLIKEFGGIDPLLDAVPVVLKGQYDRVGVVADADMNVAARWQALAARFNQFGVSFPAAPTAGGTVLTASSWPCAATKVGIWLMPDNSLQGSLETFLGHLVPGTDPTWGHAQSATAAAIGLGASIGQAHQAKGEIHTWLAWQDPSGMPFGTAITAAVLNHNATIAQAFVGWVRSLFW